MDEHLGRTDVEPVRDAVIPKEIFVANESDGIDWEKVATKHSLPRAATKHGYIASDHHPIEEWQPDDPSDVDIWVDIYLGPDENPSGVFFTFRVVTPIVLSRLKRSEKKYLIVVPYYSFDAMDQQVDLVIEKCQGRDWSEMCEKLRKHLHWEY
ncbi:MAG: Imm8 family immunity protein [Rhodospirillaceae bacterium]|nr:Imm8 family immunity protein [Rhodospirillaceae bacterium]